MKKDKKSLENIKANFLDPNPEYTPIPFWFWNDALDQDEIRRQVMDFHEKGVNGFVIHPRIGMPKSIEYLSDTFMTYVDCAIKEAKRLDMKVVLYDEGMYPSGSAHGKVVEKDANYASKGLRKFECQIQSGEIKWPTLSENDKIVSIQLAKKIENFYELDSLKIFEERNLDEFKKSFQASDYCDSLDDSYVILIFIQVFSKGTIRGIHEGEDDRQEDAPASADLLNKDAIKEFLHQTHERYYSNFSNEFGSTIIGFFTDEPCILGRSPIKGLIPWTDGFFEKYLASGNLETDLVTLFQKGNENYAKQQKAFRVTINKAMEESYYLPISKWCENHKVELMGHPEASDDIGLLKHFHIPGQDVVWRWVAPEKNLGIEGIHSTMAKCSSDAARHYGRKRNLNECFGCCGPDGVQWALNVDDMKWYLDWLFVRGVNLLIPHAFYYSVDREIQFGERPPDVGPNNSWWPLYKYISTYIKRMSYLMTDVINQTSIAVLCEEDKLPWKIAKPLYENQIEFNYLEEHLLVSDYCTIDTGKIKIQQQEYSILLVEDKQLIEGIAKVKIRSFLESGGKVIIYDEKMIRELNKLDFARIRCITGNNNLRMSHIIKDNRSIIILVNEGDDTIIDSLVVESNATFELWEPWTGKIKTRLNHSGEVFFELKRRQSLVLVADRALKGVSNGIYHVLSHKEKERRDALEIVNMNNERENKNQEVVEVMTFKQPWKQPLLGTQNVYVDELKSWADLDIDHGYVGKMTYELEFELKESFFTDDEQIWYLDLGRVNEFAHVHLNGQEIGACMWRPYVLEVSDGFKTGKNKLSIDVYNSVIHRYETIKSEDGLLGPVRLYLSKKKV
ncbi:glycosylhydrolase-like jelly roll fold domain-containing protein [Vallitalea okinawensis]|uniref:glycosylhydrolase-like jelly roll fold domain-containing protein n=1 Tax=Vallitalea okinawensis TaxID=2078660 RepID=UPI000CFAC671|nr:glycosylhydrolase-like jelly roll fold domain-containing protein [Vallitalea okinawensis]